MYRLVFCDYDGTLAQVSSHKVRPSVRAAMQAVIDAGKWITLCTSRGFQLVTPLLEEVAIRRALRARPPRSA